MKGESNVKGLVDDSIACLIDDDGKTVASFDVRVLSGGTEQLRLTWHDHVILVKRQPLATRMSPNSPGRGCSADDDLLDCTQQFPTGP